MSPVIQRYILERTKSFDAISEERINTLKIISSFVQKKIDQGQIAELLYICKNNSKRSHFGQIWSKVAATYYGFTNVQTYSGGTEVTAFNPNAIKAIEAIGFKVKTIYNSPNPTYRIDFGDFDMVIQCFSKKYDDPENPKKGFCVVTTYAEGDHICPHIEGTDIRISTPYNDFKTFDGTPRQHEMYLEGSKQMATECLYVFSQIRMN